MMAAAMAMQGADGRADRARGRGVRRGATLADDVMAEAVDGSQTTGLAALNAKRTAAGLQPIRVP